MVQSFRIPPGLKRNGILGLMRVSTMGNRNLQHIIMTEKMKQLPNLIPISIDNISSNLPNLMETNPLNSQVTTSQFENKRLIHKRKKLVQNTFGYGK